VADRVLVAATTALLFLAPFASSAGLRGAMLVLAAAALSMRFRERVRELRDRFPRVVLLAFVAWALLATASAVWSVDTRYTLSELKPEILYAALAFGFFFLAAEVRRWRLWWTALLAGTAAAAIAGVLQGVLPFAISRHFIDGGPGHMSTHLVLVAPLLFALAWPPPWGRGRSGLILAAALVLLLVSAWHTENRMVWPAIAAELLVGIAAWRATPPREALRTRSLARLTLVAGIAVTIAFAASIIERHDKLSQAPGQANAESDLRPRLWSVAWDKLGEAPWLGHGFGREILASAFIPSTPRGYEHPELRHAHNTFIDIALELGVVGLAAFMILLAALAREYWRLLRDGVAAPLGIMGLALLAGFVVKNLTDDFFYRHNALVFWAINGMLLGLARVGRPRP
jgi:O-antigen ligase